jgi:polyisoprenyl-phosphate glycosyltransferase
MATFAAPKVCKNYINGEWAEGSGERAIEDRSPANRDDLVGFMPAPETIPQFAVHSVTMQLIITMPVFEDWDSAIKVCRKIDMVFSKEDSVRVRVLLVDDGGTASAPPRELAFQPEAIENISILELRRNLGHQRAIAIALAYIQEHCKGDGVVVMDADGEDRPEEIPALVAAMRKAVRPTSIFAERGKRLENTAFRLFYDCYRILHKLLAGRDIRFGNFSILPWQHLETIVVYPELWNHYAATLVKSRLPYIRLRSDRAQRLAGKSRMDFVSLVVHGLSALFANQEVVGTRLLVMNILVMLSLFVLIGTVVGIRFFTRLAIPGWATTATGLLLIVVAQSLVAAFILVFSIMMNRSHLGFLPIRDYSHFVRRETTLYSR